MSGGGRERFVWCASSAAFTAMLVASSACARSCNEDGDARAPEAARPLAFEHAGCAQVPAQGRCELGPGAREITLFVAAPRARVSADGEALEPSSSSELQGGLRLRLQVPEDARVLEVSAGGAVGRLMLRDSRVPARLATLQALRRDGELDALEAALDAWEATLDEAEGDEAEDEHDDGCERPRLLGMRARLAFSRNEPERVDTFYRASIPALLACGRLSEAADDALALAFTRSERRRDFGGARAALDDIEAHIAPYAWGTAWLAYQRALLSMRLGELGAALGHLDEAQRRAERLDLADLRSSALQLRSWVLSLLGRHEQAATSVEEALARAPSDAPCDRATVLANLGWQRVLAAEATRAPALDARAALVESLSIFEGECPDAARRAHVLINLARLAVAQGALDEAGAFLTRASEDAPVGDGALEVALLDVRGRLRLDAGDARGALAVYDELSARLRAAGERLPVGALGRGKALLALGRADDAIEALRESEDELDLQIATVSFGMGRDTLSLGRGESAYLLVRTLVAEGRVDEALSAARRARARLLWSLPRVASMATELSAEARRARERLITDYWELRQQMDAAAKDAWTRPEDEIAAAETAQRALRERLEGLLAALFPAIRRRPAALEPAPGALVLGLFPLGDEHFVFALAPEGLQVEYLPAEAPVETLIAPFGEAIREAERLLVIAPSDGPLASPHLIERDGRALGLDKPIAYVVDLPRAAAGGLAGTTPAGAPSVSATSAGTSSAGADSSADTVRRLFVFDPRGDLRGAREEATWLQRHAAADATHDTWLLGRDATREAVLTALGEAQRMHYAGHAVYDGEAWWESGLSLAQQSTLTISDVLAARAVPSEVVLVGCGTARARPARHVATVGLAQAFIVAGAEHVVATRERIDDQLAVAFSRAYHGPAATDPTRRLFGAAVDLHERGLDWGAFVLLVP